MDASEYLYHYTSMESLALILKNRTIRLNPLDKMDDLQEQKTADIENLGKFVFVSSWTEDATESIPMWKMYTDSKAGVRVKLHKNPFLWHTAKAADIVRALEKPYEVTKESVPSIRSFLDLSLMYKDGYYSPQARNGELLHKVEYTPDITKLEPKVVERHDQNTISIEIGRLGKHKSEYWEFQKEWRYMMTFFPMNYDLFNGDMSQWIAQFITKLLQGNEVPPFRYYDLEIDPVYFSEMEITCSPQMSLGNRVILDSLVEKYNPDAKVINSELLGKI